MVFYLNKIEHTQNSVHTR